MAFDRNNLSLSVDTIAGGSIRIHFYKTADEDETVSSSGYFANVGKRGVREGDIIFVYAEMGQVGAGTYIGEVTEIDDDGDATVSFNRNFIQEYETVEEASDDSIPTLINRIRTQYHNLTSRKGGASYRNVTEAEAALYPELSWFTSNGGTRWWLLDENNPTPFMFGGIADATTLTVSATISGSSDELRADGASFVAGDVGKSIYVAGAGAGGIVLATTIAEVTDATHIVLADDAETALSVDQIVLRYWTDQTAVIQAHMDYARARGGGGGQVVIPIGRFGLDLDVSLDPGLGGLTFIGEASDKSVLCYYPGEGVNVAAVGSRNLFKNIDEDADKEHLHFERIKFEGMFDAYDTVGGGSPMWLQYYQRVTLKDCWFDNITRSATQIHYCGEFNATGNRVTNGGSGGIRARDTANCTVTENTFERVGDDAIELHTTDEAAETFGVREKIVIANNIMRNGGTIKALGGRVITVDNNLMRFSNLTGIEIGISSSFAEGNNPGYNISIRGNQIVDQMRLAADGTLNDDGYAIAILPPPLRATAASGNAIPTQWSADNERFEMLWDYANLATNDTDNPSGPMSSIIIADNIIRRSSPSVSAFSEYGFGTMVRNGITADPEVTDEFLRMNSGIAFLGNAALLNVVVKGNIIEHVERGLSFPTPTSLLSYQNVLVRDNVFYDCELYGAIVGTPGDLTHVQISFVDNVFDVDPYRVNSNSNVDGSYYAYPDAPHAINLQNNVGVIARGNVFKNCNVPILTNSENDIIAKDNVAYIGTPVATGWDVGNKGIGFINRGMNIQYVVIDADPTSATYGELVNVLATERSSSPPSSGFYPRGWLVRNAEPSKGVLNHQTLMGWIRIAPGTGHVLGTDWAAMYVDHLIERAGNATYDPASLADGEGVTTTVTVTGAALGDFVEGVSFSNDLQGVTIFAWVSAADTVSVRFQNETGGVVDLGSGTLRTRVRTVN